MRVRRLAGVACLAATVLAPGPATGHAAVATCDGRAATIVGTDRDDELTGTPGDDVIAGLGGQDTIDGGGGNDVVCGDAGARRRHRRLGLGPALRRRQRAGAAVRERA